MKLAIWLPALLAASGIFASAAAAAESAELKAPTTTTGLRANTVNKQDARRTNRYWVAPVRNSGLTCIDNSIRAGGGKPNEICMTEGEALCIEYDYQAMGGRWQFGIKDSKLRMYNPKGEVVYEYCKDVTHLCIGEEHGFDPNRYSKERPYLTLYDEKIHEVVGSLTCDGTDGENDENLGQSSILKLVDQADVGPYADYPLTLVKFKKGQTEDPSDDNSLWEITVTEPTATATGLQLESFLNYNADRCEWNSYVDSFEDLKRQIAAATDSDPGNRAKIEICEDRPIVFEDIIDFSNKYFELSCLGDGCVFDLDGYSLVTPDGVGGSPFYAEFEGITFENGSPFEGRDPNRYSNEWGGAFYLRGLSPAESVLTLKECTLSNNRAIDSGVIENSSTAIFAIDTIFRNNEVQGFGGVVYTFLGATAAFEGCQFIENSAGFDGGIVYADEFDVFSFKNCRFLRNSAGEHGGVIDTWGEVFFDGCYFEGNTAGSEGGVIISIAISSFKDCQFVQNSAEVAAGGVAYLEGDSSFDNCQFEENSAGGAGGVIFTVADSSFANSQFKDNIAGVDGGVAVSLGFVSFEYCAFIGNRAERGGVVFTASSGSSSFEDCQIQGNSASDRGGVIFHSSRTPCTIKGSSFVQNFAERRGGVIYSFGGFSFEDSTFKENIAGIEGGVLYSGLVSRSISSSVENCLFEGNTGRDGGAMVIGGTWTITNSRFTDNAVSSTGGAVEMRRDGRYSFVNSTFKDNTAGISGGAVRQNRRAVSFFNDCAFLNNNANVGGAIFIIRSARARFQDSIFEANSAEIGGAVFSLRQSFLNFEGSNFIANRAADAGGAIMALDSTTNLQGCGFIGNSADIDGGAIFSEGGVRTSTFDSCQFNGNRAVYGGAILLHNDAMASIEGCGFQDNFAVAFGGAIFTVDAETSITKGTAFSCNEASGGGAIWNEGGNIGISGGEFTNNVAVGGGGLVVESANSTVTSSLFEQNAALFAGGGAIAYLDTQVNAINDTVFKNNTSLDPSEPSDDVLDVDAVFLGDSPQDIQCGTGFDNCFCNADFNGLPNITTNDLPSTCSGAGVGTGPSPCSGCLPTPPSACSTTSRVGATSGADPMSFEEMGSMIADKMKDMKGKMEKMKENMDAATIDEREDPNVEDEMKAMEEKLLGMTGSIADNARHHHQ